MDKQLKPYACFRTVNTILKKTGYIPVSHSNHLVGYCENPIKSGFSGFWRDTVSGKLLYVTSDMLPATYGVILLRSAKDEKDYRGGANNYANTISQFEKIAHSLTR